MALLLMFGNGINYVDSFELGLVRYTYCMKTVNKRCNPDESTVF